MDSDSTSYSQMSTGETPTLARWASAQRTHFRTGKIRADRREQLDAIGFIWDKIELKRRAHAWTQADWEEGCQAFLRLGARPSAHPKTQGGGLVGGVAARDGRAGVVVGESAAGNSSAEWRAGVAAEEAAVQHWVSAQRDLYRKGSLPQDRIARLDR
ncbi:hypothetical protein T484DRAFT_1814938 [Baffinella frigidus]|nr:hypothetical protein T484DRAFT_1814938 [Cryptophyta sp. CCMP2293]